MKKILFVNACVREDSRTLLLARHYLSHLDGEIEEVDLAKEDVRPLNRETLKAREKDVACGNVKPYSRAISFSEADEIVVAAPYWDYSYPASIKCYIEDINCYGICYRYENDQPFGLCRAERLAYITTAGGWIGDFDFGYAHFKALCETFYGIKNTVEFKVDHLDIQGSDPRKLIEEGKKEIDSYFEKIK